MSAIEKAVNACIDEVIAIRRDIHKHPEIGRKEVRTSALIKDKLKEYGVDKIESPVPTAVVALIHGKAGKGKCVALRADIDALPVTEDTGLEFASVVPGMMHACGHDMHTAMLLGVVKVFCQMRHEFCGTVKLIFQHSEDTLPGGAMELVEKGVLENPHVDGIFAIHMMPDEQLVGKIALRKGAMTTSVDLYDVTITGSGGHGSEPHKSEDPILAACQMIVNMQQIVAKKIDPLETGILSIGSIHGGDAPNVIPSEVKFGGVSRAFSEEVREIIRQQVFDIGKGIETISGCKVDIYHYHGYPAAYNDADMVDCARRAVRNELGDDALIELERPMGFSEDFAYFRQMSGVPSAYLMLYGGHGGDKVYPLHSAKCVLKEEAMPYGIRTMTSIALEFLKN